MGHNWGHTGQSHQPGAGTGLGSLMAQVGGYQVTAAQPCREGRAWCPQVVLAMLGSGPSFPCFLRAPAPAKFGSRGRQGRAGPGGRVSATAPPEGSSAPQRLTPLPVPGPPRQPAPGSSAFLRKTLLTAGDTATEYKRPTDTHTHKQARSRARRATAQLQPPAQGAS